MAGERRVPVTFDPRDCFVGFVRRPPDPWMERVLGASGSHAIGAFLNGSASRTPSTQIRWRSFVIASRRCPLPTFAIIEPSKEPHDPEVSSAQWRRGRRGPRPGWRAPRRGEPARPRDPRATTKMLIDDERLLQSATERRIPRNDSWGFLPSVTNASPSTARNDGGWRE